MMKKIALCLLVCLVAATSIQAQKIGWTSADSVARALPEFQQAIAQLRKSSNSYNQELKRKQEEFNRKYQSFVQDAQAGNMLPAIQESREAELQRLNEELKGFEQRANQYIAAERQQLLAPIYNRIEKAIRAEGKAGNYDFIFEQDELRSVPFLVYKSEDDLTQKIIERLKAQPAASDK